MQGEMRILVVTPLGVGQSIRNFIAREASFAGRLAVRVEELETNLTAAAFRSAVAPNTQSLSSTLAVGGYQHVILHQRLPIDVAQLDADFSIRETQSLQTLFKEISSALRRYDLHWLPHAKQEWEKSSIRSLSPEGFVEQFSRLGFPEVAKCLLKALKVIDDGLLRTAFSMRADEAVGLRVAHCYFSDGEKGSSSASVRQVLEHLYPEKIHSLDLLRLDECFNLEYDRLYIYEDGLWSGVELLRRLQAFVEHPRFSASHIEFHFKFAATSDVGLAAARILARNLKTSRFQFSASQIGSHYVFLRTGLDPTFPELVNSSSEKIRELLDRSTQPYVFRDRTIWDGHIDDVQDAIDVCEIIGDQLMRPFFSRKNAETGSFKGGAEGSEHIEGLSNKWSLGAMRFASTIVFSSSIPKPVLPLMWLQGEVTVAGKTVEWRPLFWDVRRTGAYETAS